MAITDKTRKLLWGPSGNRCTICKKEFVVDKTDQDEASIVGEECHIISGRSNGPRYDASFPKEKIDDYDNLLLLCRTDHKMIDDQYETYTAEILRQMKINHEKWVSERLSPHNERKNIRIRRVKENIPKFIVKLTTVKQILNIVDGACAFSFYHDDPCTELEANLIGDFLQVIRDWGDIGPDLEPSEKVRIGFDLGQQLQELEQQGFYVFGAREQQILEGGNIGQTSWPVAIIHVMKKDSEEISKDE